MISVMGDVESALGNPAMNRRRPLLWYLLLWIAMIVLHQDFWLWDDKTLVFGLLPVGLAYHVAYTLLASAVMWALVRWAWPEHLERLEDER